MNPKKLELMGCKTMNKDLAKINDDIRKSIDALKKIRGNEILPLFLNKAHIDTSTVDDIFEELRAKYTNDKDSKNDKLDIILDSGGGLIDSAYNIGIFIRRYAREELNVIIPRWAKSAATLLACCGDRIEMTPVAELGPVDPQITMHNPLENRLEAFSPLDIDSTLQLIRDEFTAGHEKLARGLLERLQFPLTLGGIKKSLQVGVQYIEKLLSSRMFKDDHEKAHKIATCLVHDYSTHSFCIDCQEAQKIGLKVAYLPEQQIDVVWEIRKYILKKNEIEKQIMKQKHEKLLKNIPPELRELLLEKENINLQLEE